jgi:hypothetical protein
MGKEWFRLKNDSNCGIHGDNKTILTKLLLFNLIPIVGTVIAIIFMLWERGDNVFNWNYRKY